MIFQISVIIPCFNYGRFIGDAIKSLVGGKTSLETFKPQTFQDFEIVVVDDAGTDNANGFVDPFLCERVRYFRNETNLGTAASLNVGIRQATGKYITFLSADDMMETARLETLYRMAELNQHSFIYDDIKTFANGERRDLMPLPDYDFDKILYKNGVHAGCLYPRRAWEEIGGYPEAFRDGREDWAWAVALGSHGYCGVHVREPLYLYRWEGQNRSLTNKGPKMRLEFLAKMQRTFPNLYKGERPAMCCGSKKQALAPQQQSKSRSSRMGGMATQQLVIGSDGMVLLEYQLPKAGTIIYRGEVTGQAYTFSMTRKRGYVDSRDAPALLARIEDRRNAFVAVREAEAPAPIPDLKLPEPEHTPAPKPIETVPLVIEEAVEQKPKARRSKRSD